MVISSRQLRGLYHVLSADVQVSLTTTRRNIVQNHIQECADSAGQHINSLLEDEYEPFTMNEHYFRDYRSKFLTYYKGTRSRAKSNFIRNLESTDDEDMTRAMNDTLSSLAKMGLQAVNAPALASLLPLDPMEPAIGIMADVRAYFQGTWRLFSPLALSTLANVTSITVAYKRFVDNVPMSIDRTMLRGMSVGLEGALLRGLAISAPDGYQRCRVLLSEPEDIIERRGELQKRLERLISARKELVDAFM